MFLIVFLEKQSQYFASVFGLCGCGTRGKINVAPGEKERGSKGKIERGSREKWPQIQGEKERGYRGKRNADPGEKLALNQGEKERGSRGKLNVAPGKNDRGSKGKSADMKCVGLYFDDDIFGIPGNMDQFNTINTSASGQFLILFLVTFLS